MFEFQAVLDTNILVAALRSRRGASFKLASLIGTGKFQMHLSVPLVFEYEDVLERQRHHLGLSAQDVDDFLNYICSAATLHEIYFLWRPHLADPSDDMVLELAANAQCPFIVTYNTRHFQGIEAFGVEAVTAKEFLQKIGAIA